MGYHVTKDLKAEIKVGGSLFLKDLMGLILFPAAMYFLTSAMVADGLRIVYLLYNIVIALALLQRPKSNLKKKKRQHTKTLLWKRWIYVNTLNTKS